jgi:hypothetical protein
VEHVVTRKSQSQRTYFSVRDDFGQWDEKKSASWIIWFVERKIENGQTYVFQLELDRARCVELSNKSKLKFIDLFFPQA